MTLSLQEKEIIGSVNKFNAKVPLEYRISTDVKVLRICHDVMAFHLIDHLTDGKMRGQMNPTFKVDVEAGVTVDIPTYDLIWLVDDLERRFNESGLGIRDKGPEHTISFHSLDGKATLYYNVDVVDISRFGIAAFPGRPIFRKDSPVHYRKDGELGWGKLLPGVMYISRVLPWDGFRLYGQGEVSGVRGLF